MHSHMHRIIALGLVSICVLMMPANAGASAAMQGDQQPSPAPTPSGTVFPPGDAISLTSQPPRVGDLVVEDALTAPGVISGPLICPTGRNSSDFVPEGYRFQVTGPCREGGRAGLEIPPIPGLVVPGGEARLEARVVSGHDRAQIELGSTPLNRAERSERGASLTQDGSIGHPR